MLAKQFRTLSKKKQNNIVIAACVGVWLAATLIFMWRNQAVFDIPNFYAEDATIFFDHIYGTDPFHAVTSLFNGYLVVGQYILAYIAAGLNFLIGNDLITLPVVTALISCGFLGLAASLPYLLFRKELGTLLALVTVLLTALVPMYSFEYAILGSIANLKFVFSYLAFMLVLYRFKNLSRWQYIIIDACLLLCVLTNAPAALIVPLTLLPYAGKWLKDKRIDFKNIPAMSALGLSALSFLYVIATVVHGIPKIPGYLDQPFSKQALLPYLDRNTFYAFNYPFTSEINSYFVVGLLVLTAIAVALVFKNRHDYRLTIVTAVWALLVSMALLAINRPGIGQFYMTYKHQGGPDQFFYAQNMTMIFAVSWLLKDKLRKINIRYAAWLLSAVVLYLTVAITHGTNFEAGRAVYKTGTIKANLTSACQKTNGKEVNVTVYPSPEWQWSVSKDIACEGLHR